MRKITSAVLILATTSTCLMAAPPARAVPTRVWVSNAGIDSSACGAVASPCATFQQAHTNVAAGGEISVLTAGDYGQLSILKSVNVTNDGTGEAGIAAAVGGNGIVIAAGNGDVVSVRGVVIDGQGVGGTGIVVAFASAVHVQNCVIRNFEGGSLPAGISLSNSVNIQLFVSDTIIFNNGSTAQSAGISILPSHGASANVVLDRVHLENNVIGLRVDGSSFGTGVGAHVVVRDSVVSGNAGDGILAFTSTGRLGGHSPAFVVVERSSLVNNAGTGIDANGAGATILLNDNTVTRNAVGISAVNGGQLISYGNNKVNNNLGPDGTPTGSYAPL